MTQYIALVGSQIEETLSLLRYVVADDRAEFQAVNYEDFDKEKLVTPKLAVFLDYDNSIADQYAMLSSRYRNSKILLNSDNEFLFEELARVDDRDKVSYSVDCPWRTYHGEEVKKGNDSCSLSFVSPKHRRGIYKKFSCKASDLSNVILALAISEILKINIDEAADKIDEYFLKKANSGGAFVYEDQDNDDEMFDDVVIGFRNLVEKRKQVSTVEEAEYMKKYPEQIDTYLVSGFIQDDILYYNDGLNGINKPNVHFSDPLKKIDLKAVDAYIAENDVDPNDVDFEEFEVVIDENAEKMIPIIENSKVRYLTYFRFESGKYCRYDIKTGELEETNLIYETSFWDKDDFIINLSREFKVLQERKSEEHNEIYEIIYNPERKRYGVLVGGQDIYDMGWLEDYNLYREDIGSENFRRLVYKYGQKKISKKEFVRKANEMLEYTLGYIRDSVDENVVMPRGLRDDLFDDYSFLFRYVSNVVEK